MFKTILDSTFFESIIDDANNEFIKTDRDKYKPIFELIRTEITEGKLSTDTIFFSDADKLKGSIIDAPETNMIIYAIHTRKVSTAISNIIHENYGKYVQLTCVIPNEEYDILFNMRNLIKIYRIDQYKNIVELKSFINPKIINGIYYFPSELELIDIYHKLYLPNFNEEWASLASTETILYNKVIKNKIGGASCKDCNVKRNLDIDYIKKSLLDFINGENYVLVGDLAFNAIEGSVDAGNIQIISENSIENDYLNLSNFLSKYTPYGIYYKTKKLYIPKDNRILKYTFFIKYPTFGSSIVDKKIIDIYNCGNYELIPYTNLKVNKYNFKIGNIFVQQRFLFIELWVIKILLFLKSIDKKEFNERSQLIFDKSKKLKKIMTTNSKVQYIGINFDEKIAQKLEISLKQIKRTSYYPELSIKTDKKYKLIATS
jgi:hypothetical protein